MKMAPPVETAHVARCANRTPHALSWGRGGRVAFASCRSVVLYEPEEASVTEILNGHKGRVNCVQWAHRDDCGPETELVSGGSDNCLIVWELQNFKFAVSTQLEGHSGAVCAVTAMYETVNSDEHQKLLIASAAADSSVRIWTKQGSVGKTPAIPNKWPLNGTSLYLRYVKEDDGKEVSIDSVKPEAPQDKYVNAKFAVVSIPDYLSECVQTLTFGNGFMMDVALAQLPGSNAVILACGGDDSKIYLFVREDGHFQKIHSLMGHEDWIRGVEWALCDGNLLLASCSQDCLIRIWRIFVRTESTSKSCDGGIIKLKEDIFHVQSDKGLVTYAVTLETVLAGHDNWVYGVHWQPPFQKDGRLEQPLSLLSASMDKTMILWASDEESDMWLEKVRVGEVGGNTLGFFGCQFSPDGSMVLAHAFHGALHLWSRNKSKTGEWEPEVILSGHFGSVQDLIWDPEGEFILSVGSDQTTRLFAPWRRAGREQVTWHEIARPQIHGYDMQCLAIIGRFQFVSGADEKVLRVFTATKNFVENFSSITCTPLENLLSSNINDEIPEGASVPALGLSNKAVFQGDLAANASKMDQSALPLNAADQYPQTYFHPISLTEPPSEDHLLQNTLWAEVQKLSSSASISRCRCWTGVYKVKNHTTPGYSPTDLIGSTSFRSTTPSSGGCGGHNCKEFQLAPYDVERNIYSNDIKQRIADAGKSETESAGVNILMNGHWTSNINFLPEMSAIYGHGFEIFCVACNNASTALASACKASKVEHAAIVLWSTSNWKQILTLPFHNLTVTQLAFSPDDRFLLAVSRDRTWSLWKHHEVAEADSGPFFSLFAHTDKKTSIHSRIIWTCDWTFDSKYFVTGSRDKKVIVWGNVALARRTEGSSQSIIRPCSSVLDVGDAATAVSFSPVTSLDESYILAVGLDCGNILLYKWKPHENSSANADWMKCLEFDKSQCHTLTVKRLQWRRSVGRAGYDDEKDSNWLQLASCSTDYSINIFNVNRLSL